MLFHGVPYQNMTFKAIKQIATAAAQVMGRWNIENSPLAGTSVNP